MALEEFAAIPRDMFFGTAAMIAAACCRMVMDPVVAAIVYRTEYLSGLVHTHVGVTSFGSDRPLGETPPVMGNYGEALRHFEEAQRVHRRTRAVFPMVVTDANIAEAYAYRCGAGPATGNGPSTWSPI